MAEWAPMVSATVVALLGGMFGGTWLNRRNVARLTRSQSRQADADAASTLTDAALKLIGQAQEQADRAHREAQEAKAEAHRANQRVTGVEARAGAMGAHIAALMRQIERGDPPPPVGPPLPY